MNVVGKVGSLITQGVYSVATPFHPFGGAVDVIVVEQEDGTYRSTPWYVRFGKFQGVLKGAEKFVNISVNGVEANFHMFLDNSGEAYFVREVESGSAPTGFVEDDNSEVSDPSRSTINSNHDKMNDMSSANDNENEKVENQEEIYAFHHEHSSSEVAVRTQSFPQYNYRSLDEVEEIVESTQNSGSEMVLISVDGHLLTAPISSTDGSSKNVQMSTPQFHLGPGDSSGDDFGSDGDGWVGLLNGEQSYHDQEEISTESFGEITDHAGKVSHSLIRNETFMSCIDFSEQDVDSQSLDSPSITLNVDYRSGMSVHDFHQCIPEVREEELGSDESVDVPLLGSGSETTEIPQVLNNVTEEGKSNIALESCISEQELSSDKSADVPLLGSGSETTEIPQVLNNVMEEGKNNTALESCISKEELDSDESASGSETTKIPRELNNVMEEGKNNITVESCISELHGEVLGADIQQCIPKEHEEELDSDDSADVPLLGSGSETIEPSHDLNNALEEDKNNTCISEAHGQNLSADIQQCIPEVHEEELDPDDSADVPLLGSGSEITETSHDLNNALEEDKNSTCISEIHVQIFSVNGNHKVDANASLLQSDLESVGTDANNVVQQNNIAIGDNKETVSCTEVSLSPEDDIRENNPSLFSNSASQPCNGLQAMQVNRENDESLCLTTENIDHEDSLSPKSITEPRSEQKINLLKSVAEAIETSEFQSQVKATTLGFDLSLCGNTLRAGMGSNSADEAFETHYISKEEFEVNGPAIIKDKNLIVRFSGKYFHWDKAAPIVLGMAAFGKDISIDLKDAIPIEQETPKLGENAKEISPSTRRWRLWPIPFRRAKSFQNANNSPSHVDDFVDSVQTEPSVQGNNFEGQSPRKKFIRTNVPTTEQIASLNLKDGQNMIAFSFCTRVFGRQQVDAHVYLWKWNARIVISDVDGTITKSDVLGQFMPLVGRDWSQSGVAGLFCAIKENGYHLLFLSARAIVQAYLTRSFLLNLKQDGKALPSGPVVISPDGLFPSLYREVIRRAPHEFKIACLEDIKALFPADYNPFYAGFGNRDTDELSYRKIGIPKGKIFIINPKGEVAINHRIDVKSYTSLHTLVNDMFPPTSLAEQEDYNSWNYWKMPLPTIDDD